MVNGNDYLCISFRILNLSSLSLSSTRWEHESIVLLYLLSKYIRVLARCDFKEIIKDKSYSYVDERRASVPTLIWHQRSFSNYKYALNVPYRAVTNEIYVLSKRGGGKQEFVDMWIKRISDQVVRNEEFLFLVHVHALLRGVRINDVLLIGNILW